MSPASSKKERRILKMKSRVIEAAKKIFHQKGYKDATVDEIVDRALISKATFYQYFRSKENLFLESIRSSERKLIQIIQKKILNRNDFSNKQALKALFFYLLNYFEKDYYIIHLLFYRESQFNEKITEFIKHFLNILSLYIGKVLQKFSLEEEEVSALAYSMIDAGYTHILRWYINGQKEDLRAIARSLFLQFYPTIRFNRGVKEK
jgi:AcrR family transcriptional regulator